MNLQQTTCVITGASGGIGRCIATALHRQGAQLILVGRRESALQALNTELDGRHQCLAADICSAAGRQHIVATVAATASVNVVIQAAGSSSFGELSSESPDVIEQTIQLNLVAPLQLTQAILPLLIGRPQATLVNIGSAFGNIGFPCFSTYCASKFGLRGFTEAIQREYAQSPVSIVYFAPRATRTTFNSNAIDQMNESLGNAIDSPDVVADELVKLLRQRKKRGVVGWPEKLFCRLNGLLPEIVDRALAPKLNTIVHYARQHQCEEKPL